MAGLAIPDSARTEGGFAKLTSAWAGPLRVRDQAKLAALVPRWNLECARNLGAAQSKD